MRYINIHNDTCGNGSCLCTTFEIVTKLQRCLMKYDIHDQTGSLKLLLSLVVVSAKNNYMIVI